MEVINILDRYTAGKFSGSWNEIKSRKMVRNFLCTRAKYTANTQTHGLLLVLVLGSASSRPLRLGTKTMATPGARTVAPLHAVKYNEEGELAVAAYPGPLWHSR
jgi:hypothetical protein